MKVAQEFLNNCKKDLIKHSSEWKQGLCAGRIANIENGSTEDGNNNACHAWVTRAYRSLLDYHRSIYCYWSSPYEKTAKPFLILNSHPQDGHHKITCSREAADFLILWMARESPFTKHVLNRDDTESLLKGGVILYCGPGGLSLPETMWICKILRFPTEGVNGADTFMELVKGGVDGMLALYVASLVLTKRGATFSYTGPKGHFSVVESYTSLEGFISRKLNKKSEETSTVFGGEGPSYFKEVKGFCKPIQKSDGWGGTVDGDAVHKNDLVKQVLNWQNTKFNKLLPSAPASVSVPSSSTVYLEVDM